MCNSQEEGGVLVVGPAQLAHYRPELRPEYPGKQGGGGDDKRHRKKLLNSPQ